MQAKGGATNGRDDGRVRDATCLARRLARFGEADATAPARRHAASARVSGFRVRAGGRGAPEGSAPTTLSAARLSLRAARRASARYVLVGSVLISETLSKQVKRGFERRKPQFSPRPETPDLILDPSLELFNVNSR